MEKPSPEVSAENSAEGSNENGSRVKQEPPDEAEIRELATKISEANKAKMASSHAAQGTRIASGPGITSYFPRIGVPQNKSIPVQAAASESEVKGPEPGSVDETSRKGKFGWIKLGKADLPYILRNNEKYIAVRMVEMKLLDVYLNYLHRDIYSCTSIPSYYVTDAESKLLCEINEKHCDYYFGKEVFSVKDLVVKLEDANEFYTFLDFCFHKLTNKPNPISSVKDKCGFIRINGESVVPFTVKDEQKYVPLFYFEGETDNLKTKSEKLENWDLAYLKFCCKVQGIRNELFASDTCSVISLTTIKSYFPTGTTFEAYWPTKVVDSQLIISSQRPNNISGSNSSWIKVPPGGVPVVSNPSTPGMQILPGQQVPANGWSVAQSSRRNYPTSQVSRISQPNVHQQPGAAAAVVTNVRHYTPIRPAVRHQQVNQFYPSLTQQQAVNPSGSVSVPSVSGVSYVAGSHSQHYLPQYAMQNISKTKPNANSSQLVSSTKYPQTLLPVNDSISNESSSINSSRISNQHYPSYSSVVRSNPELIDLSSPQLSPQSNHYIITNGAVSSSDQITNRSQDTSGHKKLLSISEYRQNSGPFPYKLQKACIGSCMVPSINAKPYVSDELLVTIQDLANSFFPHISANKLREVLQNVLKVDLFKGNSLQNHVLRENNKCEPNEVVPLVQLRDVCQYMPQLNYMLSRPNSIDEPTSKRQRIS